jgi:cardiolipin synthase
MNIKSGKEAASLRRPALIVGLLVAELALLAVFYTRFILTYLWVLIIPFVLGVIFACRVAVSNKNYDSKIAWIIVLLLFSPVTAPIYLVAGESTATPLKTRRLKKIQGKTKYLTRADISDIPSPRIQQDCAYMQNTADFVPYFNCAAEYFPDGEAFFEDVLTRLQTAKKFVFLDFFIIDKGFLTDTVFNILSERAKEGVDIRVIVDGLYSHNSLTRANARRLRKAGIKIITFETVVPIMNFFMIYRNHQKIIVIDGEIGYVGGTNIADEYINAKVKHGIWKDASIRIEGRAVESLMLIFLRMWEYSQKEEPDYKFFLNQAKACPADKDNGLIMPYAGGVSEKQRLGKNIYTNIIGNARKTLYIMTPYFIIDDGMSELLKTKAQSGVDVRIIIPGIPDQKIVYTLTRFNAEKLIACGVRIFTYSPGFLHSKVMLSDGECAVVGSINMDFRSFYQQYESAAYIGGGAVLQSVADDFEKTFIISREIKAADIKRRNIFARIGLAVLRLFSPIM